MSRAYSQYVMFWMRFYTKNKPVEFKSEADRLNYKAMQEALETFTEKERDLIIESYQMGTPVNFRLIRTYERRFAEARVLI